MRTAALRRGERDLAAICAALSASPAMTDRAVAAMTGTHHVAVARERAAMIAAGEIHAYRRPSRATVPLHDRARCECCRAALAA